MLLLFGLTVGLAALGEKTLAGLRVQGPRLKRWAGGVLVALGAWFIALAIWADFFSRLFPV